MNILEQRIYGAPSFLRPWCAVCGKKAENRHHVIPRSHGGKDGPVISLCGFGNASGCHGKAHSHRLHFRYDEDAGAWEVLETEQPTKYQTALGMEGWRKIGRL